MKKKVVKVVKWTRGDVVPGKKISYIRHLLMNFRVARHAQRDALAHLIHGLIPAIKIRHHEPVITLSDNEDPVYVKIIHRTGIPLHRLSDGQKQLSVFGN